MTDFIRKCQAPENIKPSFAERLKQHDVSIGRLRLPSLMAGGMNMRWSVLPRNVIAWYTDSSEELFGEHVHQRMVLKIVTSGQIMQHLDNQRIPMVPGDAVLYFPYQAHTSRVLESSENYSLVAITFTMDEKDIQQLEIMRNLRLKLTEEDFNAVESILSIYQHLPGAPDDTQAVWLLQGILYRHLAANFEASDTRLWNDEFAAIREYMHRHWNEGISVKTLAAECGISRETLRKRFRENNAGMTPSLYLRRIRLKRAQEYLERTDKSIGEISQLCGFSNQFIFSTAFKKDFGVSPSVFRKQHRKPQYFVIK